MHRYISLFFVIMLLIARLSFVQLAVERGGHFYTTVLFYSSRTRSSTISPASSKNRRGSM